MFTEQDFIILPGTAIIIIQDLGHGDLISVIHLISVGDSAGGIVPDGSASDLVMDLAVVMDMDTEVVAGGVLPFIIPQSGVDGMEAPGLMDSMATIFTPIVIFM